MDNPVNKHQPAAVTSLFIILIIESAVWGTLLVFAVFDFPDNLNWMTIILPIIALHFLTAVGIKKRMYFSFFTCWILSILYLLSSVACALIALYAFASYSSSADAFEAIGLTFLFLIMIVLAVVGLAPGLTKSILLLRKSSRSWFKTLR